MESAKKQSYQNFEYIIVDGGSKDGTLQEVSQFKNCFSNFLLISEPDEGIYDAMNKAVRYAKGEYVFFLNMGDRLYHENVLLEIATVVEEKKSPDIIYGDYVLQGNVVKKQGKVSTFSLLQEKMPCHQTIFSRTELMKEYTFDIQYKICADRDWLTKCYKSNKKILHCSTLVAQYDTTGISSNYTLYSKESMKIIKKYYGFLGGIFVTVKRKIGKIISKKVI
jgi:glycosyltransferase involved in cell wall biosynthesis